MVAKKKTSDFYSVALIVLVVIVVILAAAYIVSKFHKVEGFTSGDMYLVMFKADWCPHCQAALPKYKELMNELNGKNVGSGHLYFDIIDPELDSDRIIAVETADRALEIEVKSAYSVSQKVKVGGFPTYYLYGRNGIPVRYTGNLDRDSIMAFVAGV